MRDDNVLTRSEKENKRKAHQSIDTSSKVEIVGSVNEVTQREKGISPEWIEEGTDLYKVGVGESQIEELPNGTYICRGVHCFARLKE